MLALFRDYLRNDPTADISGALYSWLIPHLEPFFHTLRLDHSPAHDPDRYYLFENCPNPFNSAKTIFYSPPKPGWISIKIFDITGRLVTILVDQNQNDGHHKVVFDGRQQANGVYVYQIQSKEFLNSLVICHSWGGTVRRISVLGGLDIQNIS
ncbi:MAG: T9SS type A sorting domain-containing protein [Desulfobacterales bacterium]|nr:T9SS type A sorting domain-containing protein [Desulfobacterales bacterium]